MLDIYVYGSGECDQLGLQDFDDGESKIPRKVNISNIDFTNKIIKIACGGMHTLVLTTMGRIYSWGCNDDGALGRDESENYPGLISTITIPIDNISAGDSHSIAFNTDLNFIFRWGAYRDNNGKLAEPINKPEQMDTLKYFKNQNIKKVVCGANHTLLLAGDSVYAWGNQESGQTGINPLARKKLPPLHPNKLATKKVLDIFSGLNHCFLIALKGTEKNFKGWGYNKYGQLGIGDKENYWIPQEIKFFNDNNISIIKATGGDYHSIFLSQSHEIYVCGKNDEGQCGYITQDINTHSEEKVVSEIRTETNTEDKDSSNVIPIKLEFFNNKRVNNIYSSMNFNYALDSSDNQAYSWGMGDSYVLGNRKESNEITPFTIPKIFFHNLIVDQISLGSQHVVVALTDSSLNIPQPTFEYNIEEVKASLRKEVEDKKIKTGKRKVVLSSEEKREEIYNVQEEKVIRSRRKVTNVNTRNQAVVEIKKNETSRSKSKSKKNGKKIEKKKSKTSEEPKTIIKSKSKPKKDDKSKSKSKSKIKKK